MTTSSKRYGVITHRANGGCYKCRAPLAVGEHGYWDNVTRRRLCMSCGEAVQTADGGPVNKMSIAESRQLDEMQRLVESQGQINKRLIDTEREVSACKLMLIALFERLNIDLPEGVETDDNTQ